jgi:hypothetical protein
MYGMYGSEFTQRNRHFESEWMTDSQDLCLIQKSEAASPQMRDPRDRMILEYIGHFQG